MLEHANAGDLVILAFVLRVVDQLHRYLIGEAMFCDLFLYQVVLLLGERDPVSFASIILGGIENQPTPTTADVQHGLSRL